MQKNMIRFFISLGIIFAAFTLIVFVVPWIKKNEIFWLAYAFSVFAIIIQLYVQPKAFAQATSLRSKFYGFPIARIGALYLIVQLALSLLFMILASVVPMWLIIIVFVLLLAAASIGFIAVDATRDAVELQDQRLKESVSLMRSLRSKVNLLATQCVGTSAEREVNKLADAFRFADPVSNDGLVEIEQELSSVVNSLAQAIAGGNIEDAVSLAEQSRAKLDERNQLCKLLK